MSSDPRKKPFSLPIPRRPAPRPPLRHPSFGLAAFRQNTTPFAASPLQTTMSAASNSSDSGSPPREDQAEIASRSSRSMLQVRPRAHSRSSSAPTSLSVPRQSSAESSSRSTSPTSPGNQENRRSVKHLTCFWWKEKGSCRHSDEDCLYAHYDVSPFLIPLLVWT
jgi:hypothetical protein